MSRKETKYNELIGRIGDDFYFLEYIFEAGDFCGAVANIVRPVSPNEAQYMRDTWDSDGEGWRMAVDAESTTLGLDEWREQVLAIDGDDAVFDICSDYEMEKKIIEIAGEDNVELVENVGGGRSFDLDMEWDELYNPELWEKIKEVETKALKGV